MPKLIVKPTINFFSTDSDPELIMDVRRIVSAMTDNDDYKDPQPPLATVSDRLGKFSTALSDASQGGVTLTSMKNDRRADLVSVVRLLASWVAVACKGDLTILMGSGFPIHKPTRHAVGQLDKPATPRVNHGAKSGTITARTKSVRGVFIYNWNVALASDPETILQTVQSTGASASLSGLTPGQLYCISVNAVGAAGPSDFSDAARLMSL